MNFTIRDSMFLLADFRNCPDGLDYNMYSRVITKYEELSQTGMPTIEDIFEHIEDKMYDDIVIDIKQHIYRDMKGKPEDDIKAHIHEAAMGALQNLKEGLEEEIMYALASQNLCYKSYSIKQIGDEFGIINCPQQNILDRIGGGLYGDYAED